MEDKSEFDFYNETCASCVYYLKTPGHVTFNCCRYWVPSPTAINQYSIMPHVDDVFPACGCFRRNPFLDKKEND